MSKTLAAMKRSIHAPFATGWRWGNQNQRELTAREIERMHPEYKCYQVSAFTQGMLDGILGDRYRLDAANREDESMKRKDNIGCISDATMLPSDLIPKFVAWLEDQDELTEEHKTLLAEIDARMDAEDYFETEDVDWDLDALFDALDEYAPDYFSFGSHPGDGACYGFWVSEDIAQEVKDAGGIVVSDLADIPADYAGEVLHVNDHGNVSLYVTDEGDGIEEIWAIA